MTDFTLTIYQYATISDLADLKISLGFVGVDINSDPVLRIRDTKRVFMMVIKPDGNGTYPMGNIRQLTEKEVEGMRVCDNELLFSLPIQQPTQEVWHDAGRAVPLNR